MVGGGYSRTTMIWWEGLFTHYNDVVGGGYTRSTMMWWEGAIHALQRCGGRGLYTDYNDVVGGAIHALQ